jgi:hypothetical protein
MAQMQPIAIAAGEPGGGVCFIVGLWFGRAANRHTPVLGLEGRRVVPAVALAACAAVFAEFLPAFIAFREQRLIFFLLAETVTSIAARTHSFVKVVALVFAVSWEDFLAAAKATFSALALKLIPE